MGNGAGRQIMLLCLFPCVTTLINPLSSLPSAKMHLSICPQPRSTIRPPPPWPIRPKHLATAKVPLETVSSWNATRSSLWNGPPREPF